MPKKAIAAPKSRAVDPADYNAVVAMATLRGIRLLTSSFEALPEAFSSGDAERAYGVEYELLAERYDQKGNRLTGVFSFKASSTSAKKKVLRIEGEYLVDYELMGDCDAGAVVLFVKRLGPFAAYPYFRSLVASLTSQAGLITPPLPILAEAPRAIDRAKEMKIRGASPLEERPLAKKKPLVLRKKPAPTAPAAKNRPASF